MLGLDPYVMDRLIPILKDNLFFKYIVDNMDYKEMGWVHNSITFSFSTLDGTLDILMGVHDEAIRIVIYMTYLDTFLIKENNIHYEISIKFADEHMPETGFTIATNGYIHILDIIRKGISI